MERDIILSVVVSVYQGRKMLDDTIAKLVAMGEELTCPDGFEIILVDDGSSDDSFSCIKENTKKYKNRIRGMRLSRNFGAYAALHAGVVHSKGKCVAAVSQDLQEPTELYASMFKSWREGIKINLGTRLSRDESWLKRTLALTYHRLFAKLVMPGYPKSGLGGFLVDRQVADEIMRYPNVRVDTPTRLMNMGYKCLLHPYKREKPKAKSGWTFGKNITLVIDNFISFSFMPIRFISLSGILIAFVSIIFAAYVLLGKTTGWYTIEQPPGWATIVVLISFLCGTIMIMLGIIGEYLWRIMDRVRNEPLYLIDERTDNESENA